MAEQITVPQLDVTDDPVNGILYIVKDEQDYQISYADLVKYLVALADLPGLIGAITETKRAEGQVSLTGGVENTITFKVGGVDTPFASADYAINITDLVGLGIEEISRDETGIILKPLIDGTIDYCATLNT